MWLEWIKDEKTLLDNDEGLLEILDLYEKALEDYKYPLLSQKYCKFLSNLFEK